MPLPRRRPLLAAILAPAMITAGPRRASGQGQEAGQGPAPGAEWRLGTLLPATGPLAAVGDEALRGVALAIEAWNAAPPHPPPARPARLLRGEVPGGPQAGAGAAAELRRLAAERVLLVLGAGGAEGTLAAGAAADLLGLAHAEVEAAAEAVTGRGLHHALRLGCRAEDLARAAVEAAVTLLPPRLDPGGGVPRVALLHEDDAEGQAVATAQDRLLREAGVEPADRVAHGPRGADLPACALRLRETGAAVVLHAARQPGALAFVRALGALGWRPRALVGTAAGYGSVDAAHALGPDLDGVLVAGPPPYATAPGFAPGAAALGEAYRRRHGAPPRSAGSLAAASMARLCLEALARAAPAPGGPDPAWARAALGAADLPAGAAPNGWGLQLDGRGQNLRARAVLAQWRGGVLRAVHPPRAGVAALET